MRRPLATGRAIETGTARAHAVGAPAPAPRRAARPRLALAAAVLLVATGFHPSAEEPRFLRDEQGRALILHGINVSSSAKDDPARMPWVEAADVARLADDFGFNFARFLLQWDALEPEPGEYDEAYLDLVAERMDWFAAAGILVVLDMHQDVYGKCNEGDAPPMGYDGAPPWACLTDGLPYGRDPNFWFLDYFDPAVMRAFDNFWDYEAHPELQDHYAAAWARVAERFRDHPAVLGYDLMNEPWAGSAFNAGLEQLAAWDSGPYQDFLERCIAAIRAVDADGWIFFEPRAAGPNDGQPSFLGVLEDPREGEPRLAYFPHYYSLGPDVTGVYDPAVDDSMARWSASRKVEIDAQQAPMLIGEWGTGRHVVNWRQYLEDAARMADHTTSGWAYWEYGLGGWGPIDAQRDETETADVLVRAYPQRVAGTPRFVDFDPELRVLRLEFEAEPGVTGPTEIYVPAERHYPEGFTVWTSDPDGTWSTSWDADREVLAFTADPGSEEHVVEIRPVPEPGALGAGLAAAAALLGLAGRRSGRRRGGTA